MTRTLVSCTVRTGACLIAALVTAGCESGGPAAPTPSRTDPPPAQIPQIPLGPASLRIFSDEQVCSPKTPAWGFGGPSSTSALTIASEQSGWVGRSESDRHGDAELHLASVRREGAELSLSGTLHGTLIDVFSLLTYPDPNRVTVSGDAPDSDAVLTGTYFAAFGGGIGTLSGRLVYRDFLGGTTICTEGSWFLSPLVR